MLMQREDENEAIKNEAIKNEDVKNEATKTVDVNQPPLTEYEGASMQRPSPPPPVGVLHFYQVAGILRRRSRLILMIAGIGTVLAAGVGLLIPPKYTATALLVLELQVGTGGERALAASVIDESIDTHVTLLSSRDHLQRVIESFSGAPEVPGAVRKNTDAGAPPAVKNGALQSAALNDPADSIVTETGFLNGLEQRLEIWIGALRRDESAAMPILDEVERHTRVNQQRRSRVISVSFTSTSSQKAAAFANRIVQLYVTHLIKQKQASASGEMARLGERIAESKYEMERAELAVETAARKNLSPEPNVKGEEREDEGQLRELARHAGMTAQLYGNLLLRKKQMRDDQETILPGVEITSLASVPHRPSSHNPILFIFPAFLVFAVGGSWLAVVLEQLDRGLRSRRGTSEALGIPCIGLVPQLPREAAFRPDRHLLREPFSAYTEAIRSAVVALQLADSARVCKVVLISSSVPGEGKTTLAASFAAYIALLGRRVILVDLDFRRGSHFGGFDDRTENGIMDLQLPERPPAEFIQHIAETGLDYLAMPLCHVDPLLRFDGEQIPNLVRQLRESYDCVIIDGPPVLGAAEARLLPSLSDKLLFVVKWGSTSRDVVQNALSLLRDGSCLDKKQAPVAPTAKRTSSPGVSSRPLRRRKKRGDSLMPLAILAQVDLKEHARYQYGDLGECLSKDRGTILAALKGTLRSRWRGSTSKGRTA